MKVSVGQRFLVTMFLGLLTGVNTLYAETEPSVIGQHIFGLVEDIDRDPLVQGDRALIHSDPDDQLMVKFGKASFEVSAFNQDVGAIYVTKVDLGTSEKINTLPMDTVPINGITKPSPGFVTSWGSVLYGEETVVDATQSADFVERFKPYFKGQAEKVNAYDYGWPMELVMLAENGDSKLIKHYAMGRVAPSKLIVMPDEKTVLMLSGGEQGYLFAFVAEDPRNLSQGELWVADLQSQQVKLVSLASTSTLKAKFKMRRLEFSKLFERQPESHLDCKAPYHAATTGYGTECFKLKDKRYAGVFEPHRTAAAKGVVAALKHFDDMQYDAERQLLILHSESGEKRQIRMGSVQEISSDYLPKELL